jgi:hypothetical protein
MHLSDITHENQIVDFVRQHDTENHLDFEHLDISGLFAFYIANYICAESLGTIRDIAEAIRICDTVITNFKVWEGYGGLSCDSGHSLILSIDEFNRVECDVEFRVVTTYMNASV